MIRRSECSALLSRQTRVRASRLTPSAPQRSPPSGFSAALPGDPARHSAPRPNSEPAGPPPGIPCGCPPRRSPRYVGRCASRGSQRNQRGACRSSSSCLIGYRVLSHLNGPPVLIVVWEFVTPDIRAWEELAREKSIRHPVPLPLANNGRRTEVVISTQLHWELRDGGGENCLGRRVCKQEVGQVRIDWAEHLPHGIGLVQPTGEIDIYRGPSRRELAAPIAEAVLGDVCFGAPTGGDVSPSAIVPRVLEAQIRAKFDEPDDVDLISWRRRTLADRHSGQDHGIRLGLHAFMRRASALPSVLYAEQVHHVFSNHSRHTSRSCTVCLCRRKPRRDCDQAQQNRPEKAMPSPPHGKRRPDHPRSRRGPQRSCHPPSDN